MDELLTLYEELNQDGINFFSWDLDDKKAITMELCGRYAIFMDFDNIGSRSEEAVILAHEGGHAATGATHRVSSPYDLIEKHEYKAWKWAIQRLVPPEKLEVAITSGITQPWELAEHFGVTEPFIHKAIAYYEMLKSA